MKKYILAISSMAVIAGLGFGLIMDRQDDYAPRKIRNLTQMSGGDEEEGFSEANNYWLAMKANQNTGVIDPADIQKSIQQANEAAKDRAVTMTWSELGPSNVGGRTRALLVDNQDATGNTLFAGGVSGGLWKSTTGASSWLKVNDMQENLAVSCITQTTNGDIYYGTGEGGFNNTTGSGVSGYHGNGIFYSNDGGKTFTQLAKTKPNGTSSPWIDVNTMASLSSGRVFAGVAKGLFYSDDKGQTWTTVTALGTASVKELKVDKNGVIYAATSALIWKSTDGSTWKKLVVTPMGTSSRISLAISYSNPDIIYCMSASTNDGRLEGIYRSDKAGDDPQSWVRIAKKANNLYDFDPLSNPTAPQGSYNNVLAVDPSDPDRVFAAGVDWWEWQNPTNHAGSKAGWHRTAVNNYFGGVPNYIHSDKHAIVFWFDPQTPSKFITYVGSDGGIAKSGDQCVKFVESNKGYNVTQFYGLAMAPKRNIDATERVFGGTQDNGTQLINGNGNTKRDAIEISGGDGFQAEASHIFPDVMFYGVYYGDYSRSANGGAEANNFYDCRMIYMVDQRYPRNKCSEKIDKFNNIFDTPMLFEESWSDSSSIMCVTMHKGADGQSGGSVYMTRQATPVLASAQAKERSLVDPATWYRIGVTDYVIDRLGITKDWNTVFASSTGWNGGAGRVFRFTGLNTAAYDTIITWDPEANGIKKTEIYNFGRAVTSIHVDPKDNNHVYVSLGNYGNADYIYESTNALDTVNPVVFTALAASKLPSMPVYDLGITYDVKNPNKRIIIAGTELGIWVSEDNGATFSEQNAGMARVPVAKIRIYQTHNWEGPSIYIGTHGRGAFKSTTLANIGVVNNNVSTAKDVIKVYPNPAQDIANITYSVRKASTVYISVVDLKGATLYNANFPNQSAGEHQLPLGVASFPAGTYVVYIRSDDGAAYEKLTVVR
jgi:hypothetical protein